MVASLRVIPDVFAEPSQAFRALKNNPKWFIAFVVASLILMAVSWVVIPYYQEISFAKLQSSGMDDAQIQRQREMGEKFAFVGLIFVPIQILLKVLIFGAILYFVCHLLNAEEVRIKLAFAAIMHTEFILLFAGIINAALLAVFKKTGDIEQIADLTMLPGLHQFAGTTNNAVAAAFLSDLNVSAIWYVAVLTLGIAVITNFSRMKAGIVAGSLFLLNNLALSGFVALQ